MSEFMSLQEYKKRNGQDCPYCESKRIHATLLRDNFAIEVTRGMECHDCGKEWEEKFDLVSLELNGMTLSMIKDAVDAGFTVCWRSELYEVHKDSRGQYLITCTKNGDSIGLTHLDGVTVNGKPEEFFVV